MNTSTGTLTITRLLDGAEFDALLGSHDPEDRYTVVYRRRIRPSLLRHPIHWWRWCRTNPRVRSITTTLYDCTLERHDDYMVITPHLPGGDIPEDGMELAPAWEM